MSKTQSRSLRRILNPPPDIQLDIGSSRMLTLLIFSATLFIHWDTYGFSFTDTWEMALAGLSIVYHIILLAITFCQRDCKRYIYPLSIVGFAFFSLFLTYNVYLSEAALIDIGHFALLNLLLVFFFRNRREMLVFQVLMLCLFVGAVSAIAWGDWKADAWHYVVRYALLQAVAIWLVGNRIETIRGLLHKEKRSANILSQLHEGVIEVDKEGQLVYFNKSFADMLGFTTEEMRQKWSIAELIPESERSKIKKTVEERKKGIYHEYETCMLHKDQHLVWVKINGNPILDENDNFVGSISVFTDITERKKLEERFSTFAESQKESYQELAKKNRTLESLTHELANRLKGAIFKQRTWADALKVFSAVPVGDAPSKELSLVNKMEAETQHMIDQVEDHLLYMLSGNFHTFKSKVNLNSILREVQNSLKINIASTHTQFKLDHFPDVSADRIQMLGFFRYLIERSISYKSNQAPEIFISCVYQEDKKEYLFTYRDNCNQIAPEEYQLVEQKNDSADAYVNPSFALAVCQKIIKNHHGRSWFTLNRQSGTVFYFTLPE